MSLFKQISKNIQRIIINNPKTDRELVWLNIYNTSKEEVKYLRKKYNFKLAHLQASLAKSIAQRATVEQCDDYLFIILHFPIFDNNNIIPVEIEFFISHKLLITIHNNNIPTLNDFFNTCKKESNTILTYKHESSVVLLYEILEKLLLNCYILLDENSVAINKSEETIFIQEQKKAVSQILSLQHNIINLRKIIQNHKNIIEKLIQMKSSIVPAKQIKEYYNKLMEHRKNIWEILENQKETVEALNNTNESMLNYNINNIIKTLTIFSTIVFPLTFFAALFGMNTVNGMPFTNVTNGFWIITFIMLTCALIMLLFFEKKKWL